MTFVSGRIQCPICLDLLNDYRVGLWLVLLDAKHSWLTRAGLLLPLTWWRRASPTCVCAVETAASPEPTSFVVSGAVCWLSSYRKVKWSQETIVNLSLFLKKCTRIIYSYLRWLRELNTLQRKPHADRRNTSKFRRNFQQFDSTCAADAHSTTK